MARFDMNAKIAEEVRFAFMASKRGCARSATAGDYASTANKCASAAASATPTASMASPRQCVPFAAAAACASTVGPDVAAKTAVPGASTRCETHSMRHCAAHWATIVHSSSMSCTKSSTIILFIDSTLRRSQDFFYFFPCVTLRLSGGDLNAAAAKSRAPTVQFTTSPLRPNCPLPPLANTRVAHHHHRPQPLPAVYLKHRATSVAAPACHQTHMLGLLIAQDSASKRSTP